jgi:hypothetical protein
VTNASKATDIDNSAAAAAAASVNDNHDSPFPSATRQSEGQKICRAFIRFLEL